MTDLDQPPPAGLLQGKCGIVTGAGRGIGAAIAKELAACGASVVVNDLGESDGGDRPPAPTAATPATADPAAQVVAEIAQAGGSAVAHHGSVASFAAAEAMVQLCVARFGRVDFVVHNAGIVRDVIFHKMTEADFDAVVAVHLKGCFNLCRAAAPLFREQGAGAIVAMTSTSGLIGNVGQANYAAAKLGIVALIKAIALDMRRFGVRANCIAPFAWTRMTATLGGSDPALQARVARLQALDPAQVAPLVACLLSDAAAAVTGQTFAIRGSEVVLFSPFAPCRSVHRPGGWTSQALAETLPGSFAPSFAPLSVTSDVFGYDPIL